MTIVKYMNCCYSSTNIGAYELEWISFGHLFLLMNPVL